MAVQVSVEKLFETIGRLQVEAQELRAENEQLKAQLAKSESPPKSKG